MTSDNKTPYALEAIPELIGERQFQKLLEALNWQSSIPLMSGCEFANRVNEASDRVNRALQEKQ
ncbi:hypothetical protein IWQ49_006401 [Labrenzia sp. EL_126]|nr:hypothetical protein [Labrenzia sp. EL_126]